jgi:hypothetical protein
MHGMACWLAGSRVLFSVCPGPDPDLSKRLTIPCACEVAGLAIVCWRLRTSGILLTLCGVAISLALQLITESGKPPCAGMAVDLEIAEKINSATLRHS